MLIECDECGREVSDKADACPKCGNPDLGGTPPRRPQQSTDLPDHLGASVSHSSGQRSTFDEPDPMDDALRSSSWRMRIGQLKDYWWVAALGGAPFALWLFLLAFNAVVTGGEAQKDEIREVICSDVEQKLAERHDEDVGCKVSLAEDGNDEFEGVVEIQPPTGPEMSYGLEVKVDGEDIIWHRQ